MAIKVGNIVSHATVLDWGVGKVLEVTAKFAMIQFSDGINRKIAASHFTTLQPAEAGSFLTPPGVVAVKPARVSKAAKVKS